MSKNYFTDSQVKEIALQICEVTNKQTHDGSPIYEFTENRLKALMNLAVETAIGEPVAYTDEYEDFMSKDTYKRYCEHGWSIFCKTQLYSVKELDN